MFTGRSVGWWEAALPGGSSSGVEPLRRAVASHGILSRPPGSGSSEGCSAGQPASQQQQPRTFQASPPQEGKQRWAAAMTMGCFASDRQPAAPSVGGRPLRRAVAAVASGRSAGQRRSNGSLLDRQGRQQRGLPCARAANGGSVGWWEAAPPGSSSVTGQPHQLVGPLHRAAASAFLPLPRHPQTPFQAFPQSSGAAMSSYT